MRFSYIEIKTIGDPETYGGGGDLEENWNKKGETEKRKQTGK
jgi:hypothetical protein